MRPRIFSWKLTGDLPKGLSHEGVIRTIKKALDGWQTVCGVKFVESTGKDEETDILFKFGITSRYNWMAERIIRGTQQIIVFRYTETWSVYRPGFFGWLSRTVQRGRDLLTFALHETGHALGLHHVTDKQDAFSVMIDAPEGPGYVTAPSRGDGIEARRIYPR